MSETHRITIDSAQCGGRPCLRGLRIRVEDVLKLLAAGASREEILNDHPLLEDSDITAALEYVDRGLEWLAYEPDLYSDADLIAPRPSPPRTLPLRQGSNRWP